MAHEEKRAWIMLVVTIVAYTAYVVVVLRRADGAALTQTAYVAPLVWSIVLAIAANIVLDIATSMGMPRAERRKDTRDKAIARLGDLTGQSFLVIGSLAALLLALVKADWFWIANVIYLGFVLSAILGSATRIAALPRKPPGVVKPTRVTNSIRSLRFARGEMTQADLAERIGVTRQTVIAIEQGKYSPSLEVAFQISHVFDVPLDDVFQYPHTPE